MQQRQLLFAADTLGVQLVHVSALKAVDRELDSSLIVGDRDAGNDRCGVVDFGAPVLRAILVRVGR